MRTMARDVFICSVCHVSVHMHTCDVDRYYTLFPLIPTLALLLRNIHVHVHVVTFKELNYLIFTLCGMPCLSVPL